MSSEWRSVHCHALHPVACAAGPAQLLWQITHTEHLSAREEEDTMQALPLRVLQSQHNSCGKSHTHTKSICRQGRAQCMHYHCMCSRPSTTPVLEGTCTPVSMCYCTDVVMLTTRSHITNHNSTIAQQHPCIAGSARLHMHTHVRTNVHTHIHTHTHTHT